MIYLDESNLCQSAVHSGFLDKKTGGNFEL